jgi:asparagine synthase (glutamine-hydrolysing)
MCGIYGYVGRDADLASPDTLEKAVEALWHRGPDDRGTFRDASGAVVCGFAHTRLAIIDLSAGGHQPRTTEDGRYTIVYNGEIYNHVSLRGELEGLGVRFTTSSDTEVLLAAYVRWGAECLSRLRGMFALAIWDARDRSLFLARDRLGVKPLYYAMRGGGLVFASEVRTLLAVGAVPRRLSRSALASYLAFGAVSDPGAIVGGVRALPPGCTAELREGRVTERRYWELPLERSRGASFDDEVREIRPILAAAVQLRLIADVKVGIFLSGGIDSSALVALASRAGGAPIHTFTVTFDEERFSEARFADEVARRYGCTHQQVHLPAARAAGEIDAAVGALDQPSADGINTYFVSKAAREAGLSVALSGLGGDEVFAGYDYFRSFARALPVSRAMGRLPARLRKGLGALAHEPWAGTRAQKLAALLLAGGRPELAYAALRAMFTVDQHRRILGDELGGGPEGSSPETPFASVSMPDGLVERLAAGEIDAIHAYSVFELSNYLKNTLLRDCDAMSMAHALEVRVPLLDHLLIEKALPVRGALKLSDRENKPLLLAAAPGLPRRVWSRAKMGFTLPFDTWFHGPLRPWMEATLLDGAVRRLGFLRPAAIEGLWRSFLAGERDISHSRIWCIAALAAWCQVNRVTLE